MFGNAKLPLDPTPYPRSPLSRPLTPAEQPGLFVFAVDESETVHVMPDGPHRHPLILGLRAKALYAGDLEISPQGVVENITNCSGTFLFRSKRSLCCVVAILRNKGFRVRPAGIIWFPPDGVGRPRTVRCR